MRLCASLSVRGGRASMCERASVAAAFAASTSCSYRSCLTHNRLHARPDRPTFSRGLRFARCGGWRCRRRQDGESPRRFAAELGPRAARDRRAASRGRTRGRAAHPPGRRRRRSSPPRNAIWLGAYTPDLYAQSEPCPKNPFPRRRPRLYPPPPPPRRNGIAGTGDECLNRLYRDGGLGGNPFGRARVARRSGPSTTRRPEGVS